MKATQPAILVIGEFLDHRKFIPFANEHFSEFANVQFGCINPVADNRLAGQLIRRRTFERDFSRLISAYDCLITCSQKRWLKNYTAIADKNELISFELTYEQADSYRWLLWEEPKEETPSNQTLCLTIRNFNPLPSKYSASQWIDACKREAGRLERLLEYCHELVQLLTLCEPERLPFDALKIQLIGQKEFRMGIGTASGSARAVVAAAKAIEQSGCAGQAEVLLAAVYGTNVSQREKDNIRHQVANLRKNKATPLHVIFKEDFHHANVLKVVLLAAGPEMVGMGTAI